MHDWSENPIVTLSGAGDSITLGRNGQGEATHIFGSTGLGLPPTQIRTSERLGSDGAILRGTRYGSREVFLPIFLHCHSQRELDALRARLYRLCAPHTGCVSVRVENPLLGTVRSIEGIYKEGLSGNFGKGYRGSWQTIGLVFECPDPWWQGEEQIASLQIAPGTKPFLSNSVPFFPVTLAGSVVQGQFSLLVQGDGPVQPVWQVSGPGMDLTITSGGQRIAIAGAFPADSTTLIDTRTMSITPDRWADTSVDSIMFPLQPGRHEVSVAMVGATPASMVRAIWRERYLEAI